MKIEMTPIGTFYTDETDIPRHWTVSEAKGRIEINPDFQKGLQDLAVGEQIVVLFGFHKSQAFTPDLLVQKPPHRDRPFGVFSICSPRRPNPIGLSVLRVTDIRENVLEVENIDMLDQTPILDIKPHITGEK
ncbi:tRNA-Thr(GGU) m(6)t(6)A37 methyltransferase TsaA [Desulfosalsimonas propionicica]|uniref:tRNA-Thr(GGU) m(6)t(6)A37 methyltransferase TsaA n=1 Tax=Desulfosalsimonas propionicica TaxID=332175 RepID=A0A7W0CB79_9BACT|nr:tRNA (N6-threonylcarbamoyladenosine(37)-N6)-methyltransferase TrmO [Desulfosalsimonas propionicica]MBA2882462.1 tRNA-Thr(GGU) m(6)t(6)A37 methyltransferase TsaA [Desulfosalsimonas propionicica]